MLSAEVFTPGDHGVFDLLGPTVAFLTSPDAAGAEYCMMIGTLPPGASVPLHSHPDDESFYLVSGVVEVLMQRPTGPEWQEVRPGGFVHIAAGARHGFRNRGNEPVVQLITTTTRLGRFFQEAGRAVGSEPLGPPTEDDIRRFMQAAERYQHWLGTPEENARLGIGSF